MRKAETKLAADSKLQYAGVGRTRTVYADIELGSNELLSVQSDITEHGTPSLRILHRNEDATREQVIELPTIEHIDGLIEALRYIAAHAPVEDAHNEREAIRKPRPSLVR